MILLLNSWFISLRELNELANEPGHHFLHAPKRVVNKDLGPDALPKLQADCLQRVELQKHVETCRREDDVALADGDDLLADLDEQHLEFRADRAVSNVPDQKVVK